jgi:hypothetical protein
MLGPRRYCRTEGVKKKKIKAKRLSTLITSEPHVAIELDNLVKLLRHREEEEEEDGQGRGGSR